MGTVIRKSYRLLTFNPSVIMHFLLHTVSLYKSFSDDEAPLLSGVFHQTRDKMETLGMVQSQAACVRSQCVE